MATQTESPVFTKSQAAEYLRVSVPTIDRLIRRGKLRSVRIGGTGGVRIARDSVDAMLAPATGKPSRDHRRAEAEFASAAAALSGGR